MTTRQYVRTYAYDNGLNLLQQQDGANAPNRMFVAGSTNRAVDANSFGQNPDVNHWFDPHGNQLQTGRSTLANRWDATNALIQTVKEQGEQQHLIESSVFSSPGVRSRKVEESTDAGGNTTRIKEVVYLNDLEYRTTWTGTNLTYDGVAVTDGGTAIFPQEQRHSLRINHGHRQVAQRDVYTAKDGQSVAEEQAHFVLTNNIDSGQVQVLSSGVLKSLRSYYPYGGTAISIGTTGTQNYGFSGQEQDASGLIAYGYRSYLPDNFRWINPDPSGTRGSGLNRYAMVQGNPVSLRDVMGLVGNILDIFGMLNAEEVIRNWGRTFVTQNQRLNSDGRSHGALPTGVGTLIGQFTGRDRGVGGTGLTDQTIRRYMSMVEVRTADNNRTIKQETWNNKGFNDANIGNLRHAIIRKSQFSLKGQKLFAIFSIHSDQYNNTMGRIDWDNKGLPESLVINANGFDYSTNGLFRLSMEPIYFIEHGRDVTLNMNDMTYGHFERLDDMNEDNDTEIFETQNYTLQRWNYKDSEIREQLAVNKWATDTYDNSDGFGASDQANLSILSIEKNYTLQFKHIVFALEHQGIRYDYIECRFCRGGLKQNEQPSLWKGQPAYKPAYLDPEYEPDEHFGKFEDD